MDHKINVKPGILKNASDNSGALYLPCRNSFKTGIKLMPMVKPTHSPLHQVNGQVTRPINPRLLLFLLLKVNINIIKNTY